MQVITDLTRDGKTESPRGQKTKELIGYSSVIDMNYAITDAKERAVSIPFMCAEAAWIVSGRNDLESLIPYAPSYHKFSDNGQVLSGAYGPRFVEQFAFVANCLIKDSSTRQAVMTIWKPNPSASRDIPCTLSLQFLIREGELHCCVNMRSSDAWLGRPYDTFSFTCMALAVMLAVNGQRDELSPGFHLGLGNLYFNAASQHLYEKHWDRCERFSIGPLADTKTEDFLGNPPSPQALVDSLNKLKDKKYD